MHSKARHDNGAFRTVYMVFKKQSVRISLPEGKVRRSGLGILPAMEIASTSTEAIAYIRCHIGKFLNVDFIWILGIETFLIIIVCAG